MLLFQDSRTESSEFESVEIISKESCWPGQVSMVVGVRLTPFTMFCGREVVGGILVQLITVTCMSRMVVPIKTPLRYSDTWTAMIPISRAVGVMLMFPLKGSIEMRGLEDMGFTPEKPGLYTTGLPASSNASTRA